MEEEQKEEERTIVEVSDEEQSLIDRVYMGEDIRTEIGAPDFEMWLSLERRGLIVLRWDQSMDTLGRFLTTARPRPLDLIDGKASPVFKTLRSVREA